MLRMTDRRPLNLMNIGKTWKNLENCLSIKDQNEKCMYSGVKRSLCRPLLIGVYCAFPRRSGVLHVKCCGASASSIHCSCYTFDTMEASVDGPVIKVCNRGKNEKKSTVLTLPTNIYILRTSFTMRLLETLRRILQTPQTLNSMLKSNPIRYGLMISSQKIIYNDIAMKITTTTVVSRIKISN